MDFRKSIEGGQVEFVRIEFPDLHGISRGYLLHADHFLDCYETGFGMSQCTLACRTDGNLVFGVGLTTDIAYENMALYPDLSTFRVLPWLDKTASVLADSRMQMEDSKSPLHSCEPRNICRGLVDSLLSKHSLQIYSAFEYEFHLLDSKTGERANEDVSPFDTRLLTQHEDIARDIMRNMKNIGIFPERFHTEYGRGQFELAQKPAYGLCAADNAFRTKQLVKEIAAKHGYNALWMTKPFPGESGCSAHFNHSLWTSDGENVFYDPDKEYGLSSIARSWLAGIIHHCEAVLALAATTTNCVERSNSGGFAPINTAWGLDNRSLAFRTKNSGKKNVYFEVRLPGAATNPYLLEAAIIIAGMDGIEKSMVLEGDPYQGEISGVTELPSHIKPLPKTLPAALDSFQSNEVFVRELGEAFVTLYAGVKRDEDKMAEEHREKGDLFEWYMSYFGMRV